MPDITGTGHHLSEDEIPHDVYSCGGNCSIHNKPVWLWYADVGRAEVHEVECYPRGKITYWVPVASATLNLGHKLFNDEHTAKQNLLSVAAGYQQKVWALQNPKVVRGSEYKKLSEIK